MRSGESVIGGLLEAGHEPVDVIVEADGTWVLDGEVLSVAPGEGLLGADAVFPALHGPFGEDGTVQGALECLDVPYVGAGVLGSAVCMDKLTFKRLMADRGVPQVGFCAPGEDGWQQRARALGLPLWVKPSRLGSSVGIARVERWEQLDDAVRGARRHDARVIVEAHSSGREVEVSVLDGARPEASPPGEIHLASGWYDYEAKYSEGGMSLEVPARIGPDSTARVRELAVEAFTVAGCAGMARCDFFVEESGRVLVNEVNTIPGFTETSVYAKLLEAGGIAYPELCDRLVRLAVERHQSERAHAF